MCEAEVYERAVNWASIPEPVGNIPTPDPLPPFLTVSRRFADDPIHSKILYEVVTRCLELDLRISSATIRKERLSILASSLKLSPPNSGFSGLNIARALIDALVLQLHISPWGSRSCGSMGMTRFSCATCSKVSASRRNMGQIPSISASSTT